MEKNKKEFEKEEEIDVRKIYLRNFKPHQPRVGKQYQAVIPECIASPKKKENNKIINEKLNKNNGENKKEKENTQKLPSKNDEIRIKNEIIGHKIHKHNNPPVQENEYIPMKKKKINDNV